MKQRLNSLIPLLLLTCATVSSAQEKPAERINPYIALMEAGARITSADQKCFEIPATEDEGLDMELEFTNDGGEGTGAGSSCN